MLYAVTINIQYEAFKIVSLDELFICRRKEFWYTVVGSYNSMTERNKMDSALGSREGGRAVRAATGGAAVG